MKAPVIEVRGMEGEGFGPLDFSVPSGGGVVLSSGSNAVLDELLERLAGLTSSRETSVRIDGGWLGGRERERLKRLEAVGYVAAEGGLLGNLKIWENLLLPQGARPAAARIVDFDELEGRVIEAFAVAGIDEARAIGLMPKTPDRLSRFERVVCALVRCHLAGFRLLVGDRVFDGLDTGRSGRVAALTDWLRGRHEGSALLLLHHSSSVPDEAFGLTAWKPIETLILEDKSWLVS